jgi:hypothetical protein
MSLDAPLRPTTASPLGAAHVHDRTCWWDVRQCRWAGPAHPTPQAATPVPAPRVAPED